jgi:radial spoke head protein 4/6
MLEWAGVGFGEETSTYINKSLNRLAQVSGASNVKLFGKVFALEADYWVAEGTLDEEEEAPSSRTQESRNKGTNGSVFWVTHDLTSDWVQLPECSPEQVCAARMFVKKLTGNLNASVDSVPPFPGKERHLLRA